MSIFLGDPLDQFDFAAESRAAVAPRVQNGAAHTSRFPPGMRERKARSGTRFLSPRPEIR